MDRQRSVTQHSYQARYKPEEAERLLWVRKTIDPNVYTQEKFSKKWRQSNQCFRQIKSGQINLRKDHFIRNTKT